MPGIVSSPLIARRRRSNPYALYLYYNSFTGSDGTSLSSHTPEKGSVMTLDTGTWVISGNRANCNDNTSGRLCHVNIGASDYTLSCKVRADDVANRFGAIVFRFQNVNNFWMFQVQDGTAYLYECNAGSFTVRGSTAFTATNNVENTLGVVLLGTSIICTIDGANTVSYTSGFLSTEQSIGLRYSGFTPNPSTSTFFDLLVAS